MVPVTLGLGLINFNAVIDTFVGARMIDKNLAPSALTAPFASMCCRRDLLGRGRDRSLSQALAPGDQERHGGLRETVSLGLRQIAFLLVPASVICAVLAVPITRLVYQRFAFHSGQTTIVAAALGGLFRRPDLQRHDADAQQGVFQPAVELDTNRRRARESRDQRALDVAFAGFGVWGIALSTSIVNIAGTVALLVLLRRRIGSVDERRVLGSTLRIVCASALLAASRSSSGSVSTTYSAAAFPRSSYRSVARLASVWSST